MGLDYYNIQFFIGDENQEATCQRLIDALPGIFGEMGYEARPKDNENYRAIAVSKVGRWVTIYDSEEFVLFKRNQCLLHL